MGLRPGQLDPQTAEIGHRMRELSGRKAYLRNFWYAAGGYTCFQTSLKALQCCAICLAALYPTVTVLAAWETLPLSGCRQVLL